MQEEWKYIQFTGPQRLDRDLHTLEGILRGMAKKTNPAGYRRFVPSSLERGSAQPRPGAEVR